MAWHDQINKETLNWLLEPASPGVRYLVLRDLMDLAKNDPVLLASQIEAHKGGPIATVIDYLHPEGYWARKGPGYNPKYRSSDWSIILLAQLGATVDQDERIRMACNCLLESNLTPAGQFTATGAPSGTIDCLQGNLCWALPELGFDDPRLDKALDWMARTVTGEGVAPASDTHAQVRYYAYKCGPNFACGPNNKQPCAWGAVKVMLAFSRLPAEKHTETIDRAIQAGVDFLFSTDPAKADYPVSTADKPSRNWWKFGFPVFYVTDLLQNVEALAGLGYGSDPRLKKSIDLIREKQDQYGRWSLEYDYNGKTWVNFGEPRLPNKWVTLRALRVLKTCNAGV